MFALSKKALTPQFAADFDRALDAMVKDGELRQIRERYVPCPVSADQIGCK
jgi:ABC-type amino acid transport substrate-binding protein